MRLLFVIGNLSDYHVPRYQALVQLAAQRGIEVMLVEVFGHSGAYAFAQQARAAFFASAPRHCITLFEHADEDDKHWLRIDARLREVLSAHAPDVVVTLGYSTPYSILLCLYKVLGLLGPSCKLIYMSDSKADDGPRHPLKERLKRMLVSHFDGALVAGEKHRAYACSLGIAPSRSRTGFDVIDVDYFGRAAAAARADAPAVRARRGLPPRYVLCVSRFIERKNVTLVIEAFGRSGLAQHGVALVLVGQGPCRAEMGAQIERCALRAHVRIFDALPNREMPELYGLADLVVLGSAFDQWGLCINEALAAGRPVVVTRTCGVADELVLDHINGFIVEPGDVAALAARMHTLGMDHALRARFSTNALSLIRHWTPRRFAHNLLDLVQVLSGAAVLAPTAAAPMGAPPVHAATHSLEHYRGS
jgi:glycosyltransferase involved in cell wall biosynthesis